MPSFEIIDGNTEKNLIKKLNSVEDVASEFKKFRLDIKKGKKVYISQEEK